MDVRRRLPPKPRRPLPITESSHHHHCKTPFLADVDLSPSPTPKASDALPLPLYLTNGIFFTLFFSVAYYLLHRWRDKIRSSTPLHIVTLSELTAIVSLIASFIYLLGFFGIDFVQSFVSRADVDVDIDVEPDILEADSRPCTKLMDQPLPPPVVMSSEEDEEIVKSVVTGKTPSYSLESKLGDCYRAASIRREAVQRTTGRSLLGLPLDGFDYESILGQCCEMPIGYVQIPVGIAGPLLLNGCEYVVPMATTEGCLVASTNRGCKAIYACGGATGILLKDGMTRAPVVRFSTAKRASDLKFFLEDPLNFDTLTVVFNKSSRFARLQSIQCSMAGKNLYIRFCCSTGDAMGMNMVSKGVQNVLEFLQSDFPDMDVIGISGNFCLTDTLAGMMEGNIVKAGQGKEVAQTGGDLMMEPYGVPCMVEIFHFLCSLLNVVEHIGVGPKSNPITYDEDVPLFALGLINSAVELSGASIGHHPKLLALIQDDLFHNLTRFGFSMSPLILSTVCSIVLNLYHHLRINLKLQLEAFFSCVLLRIAQSKYGASYQQQEVAMETFVDLCRQPTFMSEMYANFDCDISCSNVFEDLANLLSKSAFPVNRPLSAMHVLALDGLFAMIQDMAERVGSELPASQQASINLTDYQSFWKLKCDNNDNPSDWVPFVHKMKCIKRKLMIGADHFNRDPKKGLEFLQVMHLLPDKPDPQSVACFFRFTTGLDKNLVGDYLGNHDDFCVQVLQEFARTFDFQDMNLDIALRVFLETFRLPGESQKIQRVLEAFAERYYEQSPNFLFDKDVTLLLSYSLILLNTDQHNAQVKKKMTKEDFIRNNRRINGGNDLPREYLSELYHSICENEIRMTPEQAVGSPLITSSHWLGLMHKSKQAAPFIICDSREHLDHDMFAILSGPTVAALSVVFDNVVQEDVLQTCINGFLAVAKIAAFYHLEDVLNDLVVSLCKFTTLFLPLSAEESIITFGNDTKARMATEAVFTIANRYGDYIRSSWKNILDCVLSLHKMGILPARLASDAADDLEPPTLDMEQGKPNLGSPLTSHKPPLATPRRSSSLMGRFSQLLYLDTEELVSTPTEEQLAAHQVSLQTVQNCQIDSIFGESKFLQAVSLSQLVRALISAAGQSYKGNNYLEDEETAIFCLELLIAVTLNNRDRIMILWQGVYEHLANVVQSAVMPCTLVEKAVFGLLRICLRLFPYKENLTDELLKSLQLVLKLDARVADAYCEHITQEVMRLVKGNAIQIRSHVGWRTITSLLSITARHPEASEAGFETLEFIMSDGAHLLPTNYVLCMNAARQFAESRVGHVDRSVRSLDLMAGSVVCLVNWSSKTKEAVREEAAIKMYQDIGKMWLRLVQEVRKVCLDQREEVRNHAILMLQRILTGVDGIHLPNELWLQCFDLVIFTLLDDLLEIAVESSPKDYRNMEGSLVLFLELLSKVFLQLLQHLSQLPSFSKLWLGVLSCLKRFMKVKFRGKRCEKIHELVPELLKNTLLVMKTSGILVPVDDNGEDSVSVWQLTWLHVKDIASSLQLEIFPVHELEQLQTKNAETSGS